MEVDITESDITECDKTENWKEAKHEMQNVEIGITELNKMESGITLETDITEFDITKSRNLI